MSAVVRSPTTALPEPFSTARFQTMVQFHDVFRRCLDKFPINMREHVLQGVRSYLEQLLAHPWPNAVPVGVAAPEGWDAVADVITNASSNRLRLQRHDELVCFVSEALLEAEDDMVLSIASSLTGNASLLQDNLGEATSPSSPNSRRRFLRRRSKAGSDNTDTPDEMDTLVKDTVDDIYHQLLNTDTLPSEGDICFLLEHATQIFSKESNIVMVPTPTVLVGDVHGQIKDLKERILFNGGPLGSQTYLFLGDYVDRGEASLHCIALLVAAKIMFPDKVFLIRGNHESRGTNGCYGFLSECHSKFPRIQSDEDDDTDAAEANHNFGVLAFGLGPHPLWDLANKMFDQLPIAAIVGERIFCVHGGLSPRANHLAQIIACRRHRDVSVGGILADLTWSDPCSEMDGFCANHRGCGQLFGEDTTKDFLDISGLAFVCRAHQCVRSGYLWTHNERVLTLFSAPNYCGQGNDGAIMMVGEEGKESFVTYRSALCWDDHELDDCDDEDPVSGASGEVVASPTAEHPVTPPPKVIPLIFRSPPTMEGGALQASIHGSGQSFPTGPTTS